MPVARPLQPPWGSVLTAADRITLVRAGMGVALALLVVGGMVGLLPGQSWWLVAVATPALLLDAVDGWVARRTGTQSARGARWDLRVDTAVLLVLSVGAAWQVSAWALAIGLARYAFVLLSRWRPAWGGPLPPSRRRKVVGGIQGGVVTAVLSPVLPMTLAQLLLVTSLLLLLWSFAVDVLAQERSARLRA